MRRVRLAGGSAFDKGRSKGSFIGRDAKLENGKNKM